MKDKRLLLLSTLLCALSLPLSMFLVFHKQQFGGKAKEIEITSNSSYIYPKAIITYRGKRIASQEKIKIKVGEPVSLDGSSSLGQFIEESYRWTFSDKNISFNFGKTASHIYNEEGTYEASLLVVNDNKNMDKTNIYIQVGASAESQKIKYSMMENQQPIKTIKKFEEQPKEIQKKILADSQTIIDEILARKEKVAILVFNDTLNQLPELRTYIDLVNEKFRDELEGQLKIYTEDQWYYRDPSYCQGTTDVEAGFRIRKLLKDLYAQEHITGAILVGKIPYLKWFEERAAIGNYGPHYYNIAPCSFCYEDLDAKFTDEFKGAGPTGSVFCGNGTQTDPWRVCQNSAPIPTPIQGDKCINDGFNPQGDGLLERYYPGLHEGSEIWVAWMRPLITGNGGASNKILDNTGNLSELSQMNKLLVKAIEYLRSGGRLNTNREGEVLFSKSYFNDGFDPLGSLEIGALETPQRFRSITSFIGSGYTFSQQPNYHQVLAKDKEKYFLYFNRGYGYPEKIFHPQGVDVMFSEEIKNQPTRSLITEMATCATANFLTAPSNNFAISSIVNNPIAQAALALPLEVCWSPHVVTDNYCYQITLNNTSDFYKTWKDRFYGKAFALQGRLFSAIGMRFHSRPISSIFNHMMFGNPFIWWWQRPTPTPTPPCQYPFGPTVVSGPAERDRINYGDPELKIADYSPDVTCYPHDVVFSIWQGSTKKISSNFKEDVLASPGSEYSWTVSPPLPAGNYQWRANLKNTANQTLRPEDILKINFTVCNKPSVPVLDMLVYGEKTYQGEPVLLHRNENLTLRIKDVSDRNTSCFPHDVIFNIWPKGASMYVKSSGWISRIDEPNGTKEWTFRGSLTGEKGLADLPFGEYELRANLDNKSIDKQGNPRTAASRAPQPLIINFTLAERPTPTNTPTPTPTPWHSVCSKTADRAHVFCKQVAGEGEKKCSTDLGCETCADAWGGTCSGYCSSGRVCRKGEDNYCACYQE